MLSKRSLVLMILPTLLFLSSCSTPTNTSPGGTIPCDTIELINAIKTSNTTKEQVVINLAQDCFYDFVSPYSGDLSRPYTALPIISSPIIINGNGATLLITYQEDFLARMFYISPVGSLSINNLIFDARTPDLVFYTEGEEGGYILNKGSLHINGVLFTNARAYEGASIYNTGFLNITNSSFINEFEYSNVSFRNGGAIFNFEGDLTIQSSSFQDWAVGGYGGAVYSEHFNKGSLSISEGVFTNNNGNHGGAIYSRGELIINGSLFENNQAEERGGGIYCREKLEINGSILRNNQAGEKGGGIFQIMGDLLIGSSSMSSNSAEQGGGIYHKGLSGYDTMGTNVQISMSDFVLNNSSYQGSALYIEQTDPDSTNILQNNTFSHNHGLSAVYNGGPLTISYNTIANNSGIGLVNEYRTVPIVLIGNLIVKNGTDCALFNNIEVLNANLDSDGTCPGFSLTANPLLEPLANNGGPTLTHALPNNSPALNAAIGDCPTSDQRGEARPGGTACDLGAYEVEDQEMAGAEFGDIPEINSTDDPSLDPPLDLNICVARVQELVLCKEGPGDKYPTVSSLKPDGVIEITGQSLEGDYAVIRNPCFPELRCWVRKTHLVFYCDDGLLPLTNTPPLTSPGSDRSGTGQGTCNPGATNKTDCENSSGTWVVPLVEAPYCACN